MRGRGLLFNHEATAAYTTDSTCSNSKHVCYRGRASGCIGQIHTPTAKDNEARHSSFVQNISVSKQKLPGRRVQSMPLEPCTLHRPLRAG